ncbi:hypothetical protein GCM10011571_00050 [Marinithermofilum abyssi]|uniref:Pentapeptide MXKDX repeat protein n=1 Tax=Marinithermofilum abyssi TaxID=1571185 RepID=A0A8J2VFJ9_9BACL|nr:hypothetical protein [Marinithermofilum abyssi]GGE03237.1 hypothetical protein GCM10011571_00050 [Marinithermofilum abyssi]
MKKWGVLGLIATMLIGVNVLLTGCSDTMGTSNEQKMEKKMNDGKSMDNMDDEKMNDGKSMDSMDGEKMNDGKSMDNMDDKEMNDTNDHSSH